MLLLCLVSYRLINDDLFLLSDDHHLVDRFRNQGLHCDINGFLVAICRLAQQTKSQNLYLTNMMIMIMMMTPVSRKSRIRGTGSHQVDR